MLYPDWTTLVQLVLFVSVYFIFSRVFFAPYMRLLEARDIAQGKDIHREADAHKVDASGAGGSEIDQLASLRLRLEETTKALYAESASYRTDHLGAIRTQAKNELNDAASTAVKTLGEAKSQVADVRSSVRQQLDGQRSDLLSAIGRKLAGGV